MYKRDIWCNERSKREFASTTNLLPEFNHLKTHHRICPVCEGWGDVIVYGGGYLDPPDHDDCPNCNGLGRVNQAGWIMGQNLMSQEC